MTHPDPETHRRTGEDDTGQEDLGHEVAHPRDVRAGPGDAGAADRPSHLPETEADRRRGRRATRLLIALMVIGVLVWIALDRAAL